MAKRDAKPVDVHRLIRRIRAVVERAGWEIRGSEVDQDGQLRLAANPKPEQTE